MASADPRTVKACQPPSAQLASQTDLLVRADVQRSCAVLCAIVPLKRRPFNAIKWLLRANEGSRVRGNELGEVAGNVLRSPLVGIPVKRVSASAIPRSLRELTSQHARLQTARMVQSSDPRDR